MRPCAGRIHSKEIAMTPDTLFKSLRPLLAASALCALAPLSQADTVTQWNATANRIVGEARIGTPPAIRAMALVQTAVHEAVAGRAAGPATDAAIAAASRIVLSRLLPAQQASVQAAYQQALAALPEGPARDSGVAAGERAAAAVLARRADDVVTAADDLRPHAAPGAYVPTATPAAATWPRRKPWLLTTSAQFRPGPPPALASDTWARDYDEIKALGARTGTRRDAGQTAIARFWDYSLPAIYHGAAASFADAPGRDVAANARLFARLSQAMDDAVIAVMDAKYHYRFWRPVTAIRSGDADGNDATERDPVWLPLIDTPMHPEYPCAHCTLAGAVGAVLEAEAGSGPMPVLATRSPTAGGAQRRWTSVGDFVAEVADARVWGGVHYRESTRVGVELGQRIGRLAAQRPAADSH